MSQVCLNLFGQEGPAGLGRSQLGMDEKDHICRETHSHPIYGGTCLAVTALFFHTLPPDPPHTLTYSQCLQMPKPGPLLLEGFTVYPDQR